MYVSSNTRVLWQWASIFQMEQLDFLFPPPLRNTPLKMLSFIRNAVWKCRMKRKKIRTKAEENHLLPFSKWGKNNTQGELGETVGLAQEAACSASQSQDIIHQRQWLPTSECGCGYSGLRCSCWAAFQMLSEQHKSWSVLSSVHVRRAALHFPCTAFYISVSGTDRLIANSHCVRLTLLSSAGSNKKKEKWSRNPISIVPSAGVEVPFLWAMWTFPFLLHSPVTILWHKGRATSTQALQRDFRRGTHSVST